MDCFVAYKFGVLTKIVRHMKTRHMAGEDQPLTLEEILDETRQLDVTSKIKLWLSTEALNCNPKISASERMTPDGPQYTYLFKPPFEISSKKMLIRLLEKYDRQGLGGIFMEDLQESLPRCEKIINILLDQDRIIGKENRRPPSSIRPCKPECVYLNDSKTGIRIKNFFCSDKPRS